MRKSLAGFNEQMLIKEHTVKHKQFIRMNLLLFILVNIIIILMSTATYADHQTNRHYYIRGVAATGINDLCGAPIFSLQTPEGIPPTVHATVPGEYDPEGVLPIPLSATNCNKDIIIATNTDLAFLTRTGLPDIDIRLKNIPLGDVPVISNPDGSRSVIPTLDSVSGNALPPTKSDPNGAITLGDWLGAQGSMYLRCIADGIAKVKFRFRNLIPNGVYSLWRIWNTTPPGSPQARLVSRWHS